MSNSKFVHRHNAPFTLDQYKFIIKQHAIDDSVKLVQRAFRLKFYPRNPGKVPGRWAFERTIKQFEQYGTCLKREPVKADPAKGDQNIAKVKEFFDKNPDAKIRKCVAETNIKYGVVWRILRKVFKWKPYRPRCVQKLSDPNKEARLRAANFFETFDDAEMDDILWSDEKWFVLDQSPNRKNDVKWGPVGTENIWDTKKAHGAKVMAWCGIIRGQVITHWFEGSVNEDSYLEMLETVVWPVVKNMRGIWFQQDGAPPHVTPRVLEWLHQKFGSKIISRNSAYPWPPYSPDLSPLDFSFWSQAMAHVVRCKPQTLDDLKEIVEDFADNFDPEIASRVVRQVKYRAALLKSVSGGHFQHLLKHRAQREE